MDNDALDWKKVFKKILGEQKQFEKDKSLCLQESLKGSSSAVDLEDKELRGRVTSSSCSLDSSSSDESSDFKNSGKKFPSFHELTLGGKAVCELNNQDSTGSIKHKYSIPKSEKNIQVPEWNKVFKSILDKKSPVPVLENQKMSYDTLKKQKNLQKHAATVNTRCDSRKKFYRVPETKETPEEKEVKELFAISRMFKLDYHNNLNEFEGAGVDIFKCDKDSFSQALVKSTCTAKFRDKVLENEYDSESFVPLKGFVANLKPYTTADLLASPKVPFTEEPWDDELLI